METKKKHELSLAKRMAISLVCGLVAGLAFMFLCGNAAHGAGVCNAADGQRNGGKDHGDDHQLQRLDEELADDVEDAKGTLSALGGDILEQQVVA